MAGCLVDMIASTVKRRKSAFHRKGSCILCLLIQAVLVLQLVSSDTGTSNIFPLIMQCIYFKPLASWNNFYIELLCSRLAKPTKTKSPSWQNLLKGLIFYTQLTLFHYLTFHYTILKWASPMWHLQAVDDSMTLHSVMSSFCSPCNLGHFADD